MKHLDDDCTKIFLPQREIYDKTIVEKENKQNENILKPQFLNPIHKNLDLDMYVSPHLSGGGETYFNSNKYIKENMMDINIQDKNQSLASYVGNKMMNIEPIDNMNQSLVVDLGVAKPYIGPRQYSSIEEKNNY